MPVEPAPSAWEFPDPELSDGDLVGLGADLEPGTLLEAYRSGVFPMPVDGSLAWWSPDQRGILPLEGLHVSRTLRRSCRLFEVRVDTAFDAVVEASADPRRPGGWITRGIRRAYGELHRLGWAHSVETWAGGELVGGLYGVAIGGLFAGESMFHRRRDASKAALVALVELLRADGEGSRLLDVQWCTDHLRTLGVVEIPRREYVDRLRGALKVPLPPALNEMGSRRSTAWAPRAHGAADRWTT